MRAAIIIVISCVFLSCAGKQSNLATVESAVPVRVPIGIAFEKAISGRLLTYDLKRPSGLALDAQGSLYISDNENHRIIKLDPEYHAVRDYGGYGGGVGQFINPEDLVIDRGLNLYILDTGNRRIVQLDVRLNFVGEIFPEDDPNEIISNRGKLSGLQISSLGEITVADHDNSRLIRMDNFNRFSRYIGDFGYGRGALLNPEDMASDKDGRLYVADAGNGRIAVYDDYGNYLRQIGGDRLRRPTAVAAMRSGIIWVADSETRKLYAFTSDGLHLLTVETTEQQPAGFSDIMALAVSENGRIYIADTGQNRVMVYRIVYEGNQ